MNGHMITGIYKITNIINGKCYVGSAARNLAHRWYLHKRLLRLNKHHSIILQRAWNKYGENSFEFETLEECIPEKCIEREQYYIDIFRPEYNICRVAGSPAGIILSEVSRKKISDFHKGKPKSEIHKKRISDAQIGKIKSKEHVEKMKEWAKNNNSGEKSYFHNNKFIFSGENNSRFTGYYKFKNKITQEEIIVSKTELSKKYNIPHTRVCAICNGKRKSTHKWICLGKE